VDAAQRRRAGAHLLLSPAACCEVEKNRDSARRFGRDTLSPSVEFSTRCSDSLVFLGYSVLAGGEQAQNGRGRLLCWRRRNLYYFFPAPR